MKTQYWNNIHRKRVAILGVYPPPRGGVSTHIERVIECFSQQKNVVFFWNTETRIRIFLPLYFIQLGWWLSKKKPHYLYYHSTYLSTSIIELLFIVLLRMIIPHHLHIIDHDCRHLYHRSTISKKIYRTILHYTNAIICMGESIAKSYKTEKIADSLIIQSPFIPPNTKNKTAITASYPSSLKLFIHTHKPLILMNAAHLMRIDNSDLYGIDTGLYLMAEIADEFPKSGLIIGLSEITNTYYFVALKKLVNQLKISHAIYILHANKQIWPLFEYIDLFIRPTLSDGDSISIREALYFGVPVIASNACPRPPGVICFAINNKKQLSKLTKKTIQEKMYEANRKHNNLYEKSI